ncbi:MAG TPA: DUF397 domain-containing protein [Jiangellaceae bacterium]
MTDDEFLVWRKASFSNQDPTECVEVADLADGGRLVRDSKNPSGGILRFTAGEWSAFVQGVHAGEFG